MGRSLPLVVVAAVVVFLLVLVPAPLVLAGFAGGPKLTKTVSFSSARTRAQVTQQLKSFFRGAWKGLKDRLLSPSGSGGKNVNGNDESASLFIFNLSVGTGASSPQTISGILDITTPLVWAQCTPCSACLPPPAPAFQPSRSPTFAALQCGSQTCQRILTQTCAANNATDGLCGYIGDYGAGTNTTGYLATDTFTFGNSVSVPSLVFGCSAASAGNYAGASGVFGFSRGPLSFASQLQLSWFSYFLASSDDDSRSGSSFRLSGDDDVNQTTTADSRSTHFLTSRLYPELYYVNLTGVRVGKDMVGIPAGTFDLRTNGSGGVFLSTTMPVTFLEEAAYNMVRQAIVEHITPSGVKPVDGSALDLDLCYNYMAQSKLMVPEMALVFGGGTDAVTMELKESNYFFTDDTTGLKCLTMLPSQGVSLLGSLVQTGRNMTYDIAKGQLIFEKKASMVTAQAAAAPAVYSVASLMMTLPLAAWVLLF